MATIVVSDRLRCQGDFLARIAAIAATRPHAVLLREPDMTCETYGELAAQCHCVCAPRGVPLIVHTHETVARTLGTPLHLRMVDLKSRGRTPDGIATSTSIHSMDDAIQARALGCAFLIAGHIFDTDCKAGTPGRGLAFLRAVCAAVDIPIFAIGGVTPARVADIRAATAAGVCVMSAAMTAPDPAALVAQLEGA